MLVKYVTKTNHSFNLTYNLFLALSPVSFIYLVSRAIHLILIKNLLIQLHLYSLRDRS